MFIRHQKNKSGIINVQIIDKSSGKYPVHKTIGSSDLVEIINNTHFQAKEYFKHYQGTQKFDFSNTKQIIHKI